MVYQLVHRDLYNDSRGSCRPVDLQRAQERPRGLSHHHLKVLPGLGQHGDRQLFLARDAVLACGHADQKDERGVAPKWSYLFLLLSEWIINKCSNELAW